MARTHVSTRPRIRVAVCGGEGSVAHVWVSVHDRARALRLQLESYGTHRCGTPRCMCVSVRVQDTVAVGAFRRLGREETWCGA